MENKEQPIVIKNCFTCAHIYEGRKCILSGFHCETQRKYPSVVCDVALSGWTPKEPKKPKKPRRSLRQYIYDILWRC